MKNKTITLIIIVAIILGIIYYLENLKVDINKDSVNQEIELEVKDNNEAKLKDGKFSLSPELTGIVGYINADEGIKISDFKGKVVLIDFWTYTCINCIRTLPFLTAWDERYRDKGLVIIGVHTPEFEFEKNIENVKDAVNKYGIKYRVIQDNDYHTWRAFKNRYWPRKYLIDSEGYIRYDHIGEGGYAETEEKIQELLAEIGEDVDDMEVSEDEGRFSFKLTPELYAGVDFNLPRGQNIGNKGGLRAGEVYDYSLPNELDSDVIYLKGRWKSNSDDLELVGELGSIVLIFNAEEVNIVADSIDRVSVDVLIDDKIITNNQGGIDINFFNNNAFVTIDKPQLYNIVSGPYGEYKLELKVENGFSFNAFTFG
jgi:thiol-disulfide isomerase/thioredoxin